MLCVKPRSPVDYSKCNQTVTVYHADNGTFSKQTFTKAFLEHKKTQNVDKTGSSEANSFLLVIPCSEQVVFVGDKVLLGEGQDIATPKEWSALIPANVPGLVVVKYVDSKYWQAKMVHVEAGG